MIIKRERSKTQEIGNIAALSGFSRYIKDKNCGIKTLQTPPIIPRKGLGISEMGLIRNNIENIEQAIKPLEREEEFRSYMELELEYNQEHHLKPFLKFLVHSKEDSECSEYNGSCESPYGSPKTKSGRCKGRKRIPVNYARNMDELITKYVLPKWKAYLKTKAEGKIARTPKPRSDTVWKKILRDVREFFRILFRFRFHYLEYKDEEGARQCIKVLFEELNIPYLEENEMFSVFKFLHQTHKVKVFEENKENTHKSPLDVIEKYNEGYRKLFMTDLFCSRLFYFVFKNYLHDYCQLIKLRYRKEITIKICMMLNCYKKMKKRTDIDRIRHHLC